MASSNRKRVHNYKLSYVQEVGSSLDPDMEDIAGWEAELGTFFRSLPFRLLRISVAPLAYSPAAAPNDDAPVPEDFDDDADLAALVEEYQECEDWEQLADQIFAVSDDEVAPSTPKIASARPSTGDADVDMA
jgi:hypothetical protein